MENNPTGDKTREIDWWFMTVKAVIVCEDMTNTFPD